MSESLQEIGEATGVEKAQCPMCERPVVVVRDLDGIGRSTAKRRFSPHSGGNRSFGRLCEKSGELTDALVIES